MNDEQVCAPTRAVTLQLFRVLHPRVFFPWLLVAAFSPRLPAPQAPCLAANLDNFVTSLITAGFALLALDSFLRLVITCRG